MNISIWKVCLIILPLLFGFYIWPPLLPFANPHCEFETGSNRLIKNMIAEAEAYLRENGKVKLDNYSYSASQEFSEAIETQINEFAMKRDTLADRISAMHALLSTYGMKFNLNFPTKEQVMSGTANISYARYNRYEYIVSTYQLNYLCALCYLIPRNGLIIGLRKNPKDESRFDQVNLALRLYLTLDWSNIIRKNIGQNCPELLK